MVANVLPARKSGASGSAPYVLGHSRNLPSKGHTHAKRGQLKMD